MPDYSSLQQLDIYLPYAARRASEHLRNIRLRLGNRGGPGATDAHWIIGITKTTASMYDEWEGTMHRTSRQAVSWVLIGRIARSRVTRQRCSSCLQPFDDAFSWRKLGRDVAQTKRACRVPAEAAGSRMIRLLYSHLLEVAANIQQTLQSCKHAHRTPETTCKRGCCLTFLLNHDHSVTHSGSW
jgi:hypothetical protein